MSEEADCGEHDIYILYFLYSTIQDVESWMYVDNKKKILSIWCLKSVVLFVSSIVMKQQQQPVFTISRLLRTMSHKAKITNLGIASHKDLYFP